MGETVDLRWKPNTCPICARTFIVTPQDDYFIPACGCYDDAEPGHYPCEPCGLEHIFAHKGKPAPPPEKQWVAITDEQGKIVAQAEGKEAGDALLGEFFIEPEGN